ncbi:hypothetical protein [Evansella cellulosilytica]|uniref:Uncharacterized protein n=1 Tax=Evansella cellulosilytica (strain ATCC 21833 / DSM 2522 / FERM P-1141 / JCM 9156 / N-4) TaxID=649639 RepID=E6TR13_EVAC2|nr:hypothetical protein [Evansella cellulosilytica]ADU29389.1 hypothetical protein Bcell_1119 [Evansella cellulosilytica DSM 2522]
MNLMKLEMMNGTERVAEALQMRGLFIEVKNDIIVLTKENTAQDIEMVPQLLSSLNIPTFWVAGDQFQVLVNRLPIATMKKIMNVRGHEFPVRMEAYHYRWRAFAQRRFGIKVNALNLDPQVAMMVKVLNLAGITTLAGCNGHHRYSPNFQLSGVFQGAWFEIIQEKYLSKCDLHYKWSVHYGNQSGASIIADKHSSDSWDMNKIYQDTVQIATTLLKDSEEIRQLKKQIFKRDGEMKQMAERFVLEKDYKGLVDWMRGLVA